MAIKSRTVRELIDFLSKMPPEAIIATGHMWLKEDCEDFIEEPVSDEQWDRIAYYYERNERLGEHAIDTMSDAIYEITKN